MAANIQEQATQAVQTFEIVKQEEIAAPIGIVFETILEQMGPLNSTPEKPMPMKLEAWPGGRWFRDLGNNTGHFWGVVQAIKPPSLLEICGPLFMSTPAVSNLQYRLTEENGVTRLRFVHRAMGWIGESDRGVDAGWTDLMTRIRNAASKRGKQTNVERKGEPMCPACIATVAWIAAGTTSTGGISALVVSSFRGKKLRGEKRESTTNNRNLEKGERHGQQEGNEDEHENTRRSCRCRSGRQRARNCW